MATTRPPKVKAVSVFDGCITVVAVICAIICLVIATALVWWFVAVSW